jgi:hemophore-related protein
MAGLAIAGTMLVGTAATGSADPPNCTAADLAGIMSGVSASTSGYLFTHPDVNAFFTSLKGQPRDAIHDQVRAYLEANPQVKADLQGIRQPSTDFKARCGVEQPGPPE